MRIKSFAVCAAMFIGVLNLAPAWSALGRIAGSFNVTQNGAATYSIPIFTPPGPRGMQPSIALVYSSNGGVGPVGKGWSIAGLSAITRCNRTVAQDGIAWPIVLQTADQYCLNGNRLRLTSGTLGTAGSTYQTELANFSQVTAVGTAGNGPASFTVKGKDGLTYEYGTDSTSQVLATGTSTVSVWMLRQISDRSNNRVRFTYVAAGSGLTGTTNPSIIEWTATTSGGSTFRYSMSFTYGSNTPPSSQAGYVAGTAVADDDLLTNITVNNNGNVAFKYFLAYNTSPTTGVYRLQTVTECSDSAGSDCLLPTTVSYQNGQAGVSGSPVTSISGSRIADFNGDGFEDIIYTNGSNQLMVAWGSTSGAYSGAVSVGANGVVGTGVLVGDVQGTGKDIILVASGGVWYSYIWNGSSFASAYTGAPVSGAKQYLLDIDGDGRADLVSAQSSSGNLGQVDYRASTSSSSAVSFSSSAVVILSGISPPPGSIGSSSDVYLPNGFGRYQHVDINGDGKEDLTVMAVAGVCDPVMPYPPYCTFMAQVTAYVQQPNGSFVPYTLWGYSGGTSTSNYPIFLRANDDACSDTAVYDANSSTTTVYLSACDGSTATSVTVGGYLTTAMDWDGDGRLDLMFGTVGSSIYVSLSTGVGFASPVNTGLAYCTMAAWDSPDSPDTHLA